MNAYQNKSENKVHLSDSKESKNQAQNQGAFQFKDNRKEAFNSRELSIVAENSPHSNYIAQFQSYANPKKNSNYVADQRYPIQRKLQYGPQKITSLSDLPFTKAALRNLFNAAPKHWKARGINSRDTEAKEKWIDKRIEMLQKIIDDPEVDEKVTTPDTLKNKVYDYMATSQRQESELARAVASIGGSSPGASASSSVPVIDTPGTASTSATSSEHRATTLYNSILRSYIKNVFPLDNLEDTHRKALEKGGHGFTYELGLGLSALQQVPGAKVQFGTLSTETIEKYLGGKISAYKKEKKGGVGADITVWFPPSGADGWGGDFIQSKSIKFSSLSDEIKKARNQLEGNNASGNTGSTSLVGQREISLRGDNHMGSIFIEIYDGITDPDQAAKLAEGVLTSPYVHSVVLDDLMSGEKSFYNK